MLLTYILLEMVIQCPIKVGADMFNIGDYVLNAVNGICEIIDIVEMDMLGNNQVKKYFFLVPESQKSAKVYIPVENADARIRKIISKDEASKLLSEISDIDELVVNNEKERELTYKNAIKSCDIYQLVGLIKCIFRRRAMRLEQGKKCTAVDERYFKNAENNLYSELAFVLEKDKK